MAGVRMLYACRYRDALNHFQEAVMLEPGAKGYLSYLGLATAHAERKFSDGEQLCRRAIEQGWVRPARDLADLHRELARLGLVRPFGTPFEPGHRAPPPEMDRVVSRVREVMQGR